MRKLGAIGLLMAGLCCDTAHSLTTYTGLIEDLAHKLLSEQVGDGASLTPSSSQTIPQHTVPPPNASNLSSELNPLRFAGGDIGAQINAAAATCSTNCLIRVPAGTYNQTTTILLKGTNIRITGPGATLTYTGSSNTMIAVKGKSNKVDSLTFNLNGIATYAVVVEGAGITIEDNTFTGKGNYGIVAQYAGDGLMIANNTFNSNADGYGVGPISINFTSHFSVVGNHLNNTDGFGITMLGSSSAVVKNNDIHQPAYKNTVTAGVNQTLFNIAFMSHVTRIGVKVNGTVTPFTSYKNTGGNNWAVILPTAPTAGAVVTFTGWQSLENIQVNSQSFDISITDNTMDGTGDSGIDVVSDYHATNLQSITAANNQKVFNFTGSVTFFPIVEINGRVLTGSAYASEDGPIKTSGNNWTVTLVSPQPSGTVVSFMNFAIGPNTAADYPAQVIISGNSTKRAAATGLGVEIGAPNITIFNNIIEDCGQAVTDTNYSSGIFVANSLNTSINNNTVINSTAPGSMREGISLLYTTTDDGSMDKKVKVGGNKFSGTFQNTLHIPTGSPMFRQTGIDVAGTTIAYPESVNTDSKWTGIPENTKYITYGANGITLIRDTINKRGGVASIGYPGNGGNMSNYVTISPTDSSFFGNNSIFKVSWWAKVTSGVIGVQLYSYAGGSYAPQEVDASGSEWKQYSIYLSTNGIDLSKGIFIRLVGSGTGNFENITFATSRF